MKVLVSSLPPSDSLALSRLSLEDYALDLKSFLEQVILVENQELKDCLFDLRNRYPDRLPIFIDLWRRHPKLLISKAHCDFIIREPLDIKSCFANPLFLSQVDYRKPQGKLREDREVFYSRVFQPFVDASKRIEIFDPYILSNLSKPKSGLRWLIEKKIKFSQANVVLVTVEPKKSATEDIAEYSSRLEILVDSAARYLESLPLSSNSGIRLYILPEDSNQAFTTGVEPALDSDKHDRFMKFCFNSGNIGIGLTKGTEYFSSKSLQSAWSVHIFDSSSFAEAVGTWSLHDAQSAQILEFGRSFEHDLGCYPK